MSRHSLSAPLTLSGFIGAFAVAVFLALGAYWVSAQHSAAAEWVGRTHEVLASIARTQAALVDIQNGHRGFTISGDERDLAPYEEGRLELPREMALLRKLLADDKAQRERVARLEEAVRPRLASAAALIEARRTGGFAAAKAIVDSGRPTDEMNEVRQVLRELEEQENLLLARRLAHQGQRLQDFWIGMATLLCMLFAALTLLYVQIRRRRVTERRLIDSEEELHRLNVSLESTVEKRTQQLKDANEELKRAEQRLRQLSARLITVQEQERRHIARELHDETGQALTVIRLHLADALKGREGIERLPECMGVVDRTIAQIRNMALNLRPTMLDDLGLVDALEWVLVQQAKAAGWKPRFHADDLVLGELDPDVNTACFRIAQEALTNAARHAKAREVRVQLWLDEGEGMLRLAVTDDGIGFDPQQAATAAQRQSHFGLVSMAERADLVGGSLEIESAPERGTRIHAAFPLRVEAATLPA